MAFGPENNVFAHRRFPSGHGFLRITGVIVQYTPADPPLPLFLRFIKVTFTTIIISATAMTRSAV